MRTSENPYLLRVSVNRGRGPRRVLGTSPGLSGLGAPARAQPVQSASLEVVTQSSSLTGLPQ
jgi:hypothetical protein